MARISLLKIAAMAGLGAMLTVASVAQAQDAKPDTRVRIRGVVTKLEGTSLLVKAADGTETQILLKPGWKVQRLKTASLDEVKPGDYLGVSSQPTSDGGDGAVRVMIFPAAMKGTGEGSRPLDAKTNSSMTNATVSDVVKSVDGKMITVTYQGKEKKIRVPDGTPVVTYAPATEADLKAGVAITASGERGADGVVSVASIVVDTISPPM